MTPLPDIQPGFAGDPHVLIRTAEVAARLGYRCLETFYNDKPKREAARFPAPLRRGLYRLGDLQDWAMGKGRNSPSLCASEPFTRSDPAGTGEPETANGSGSPSSSDARPRNVIALRLASMRKTG